MYTIRPLNMNGNALIFIWHFGVNETEIELCFIESQEPLMYVTKSALRVNISLFYANNG
jgi:hypothetical protein